MTYEQAQALIERTLPEKRYIHTLGVVETAERLARTYGEDVDQARLAAMLHDYAKYHDRDEMRQIVLDEHLDPLLLEFDDELLHAPVGAVLLDRAYDLDAEVISAIKNHTTGEPGMSRLDQILFVADAIEPNRRYPGVDVLRDLADVSLEAAVVATLRHTINYLLKKSVRIFPQTITTYNYYLNTP
ncbi:HD domain-containing protein [Exiguobacterium sp. SH3S2]|uniref:bis(5'-nucleosyl)-tetraphosphatase (symmetrical) YqeK n=1 Tax=Exiguobacterium TaxID=33986 RepID=UPI0008777A8E|nr:MULTISPECIES: bis(5'-nucleosyl)-tetraphosphatase (symmetrical) YqeK [Exiguobacterium]TCI37696.1 HD domain-containing protein [Exiguobacterium sp. SH4S7]TCI42067.1 HD domain-containing protein [Exiguobacterium sp. SH5S32]TCI44092.1 HD domain-containing protein [Exiguobacterium sp. SH3S3]TCI49436.1 HD domain-containing protein [Exiguobacterium sp. SH1S4]TCI51455.1 HD domain-containing protein [Exiguobacterium sp. SH1S21]